MRIFTGRQWQRLMRQHRDDLAAARNDKLRDYEREQLERYERVMDSLWEKHGTPRPDGQPGDTRFGQMWWCSGCNTGPWPCATARAVLMARGFDHEYTPLRLPIRGEKRVRNGIELGAGHWLRVEGIEPCDCRADEIAVEETA